MLLSFLSNKHENSLLIYSLRLFVTLTGKMTSRVKIGCEKSPYEIAIFKVFFLNLINTDKGQSYCSILSATLSSKVNFSNPIGNHTYCQKDQKKIKSQTNRYIASILKLSHRNYQTTNRWHELTLKVIREPTDFQRRYLATAVGSLSE